MKKDLYNTKERYQKYKEKLINGEFDLSSQNRKFLLQYLEDMENGINISTMNRKGSRSYSRLYSLKNRLMLLMSKFNDIFEINDITLIKEEQLHKFFTDMRNGVIKRRDGKDFMSAKDYVKDFKAFWHWYQKTNRKKGIEILDITTDLDTSGIKPKWVYLTEDQVKKLTNSARYDYRVLIMFLFDTGIRAPSELLNIKVSDFYNNFKELNIREEISKTFGRKIKLILSSELIKEYILEKELEIEDYLFNIRYDNINRYLRRLAKRVLGEGKSLAGDSYSNLTMYDFRHCSCCYWLPRYKSESALKYRFGWKKSEKIHYYSEMLGMRDTISEEDILIDVTKIEIEKRLIKSEKKNDILTEEIVRLREQMQEIYPLVNRTEIKLDQLIFHEKNRNQC